MTKLLRLGLAAAVLAGSIACSGNDSTSPSDLNSSSASKATVTVTVRPSPITATRCNPQCPDESGTRSFNFSADLTIDIQDGAAVGATVNSVTLTASADGGTFAPLVLSADDIKGHARTNHVDAHGTLSIPMSVIYNTPSGNANLEIAISLQATDDRNNAITSTGQVSVR